MAVVMTCCAVAAFTVFTLGGKFLIPIVDSKVLKQQDVEMATDL